VETLHVSGSVHFAKGSVMVFEKWNDVKDVQRLLVSWGELAFCSSDV